MSEITAEKLAAALAGGFVAEDDLNGWVSVSAKDNVASIEFTPIRHEPGKDGIQHFRAVVVKAPTYAAAAAPVVLYAHTARELAYEDAGYAVDGWTVVANEYLEKQRWESLHRLVIRSDAGHHYADTYRRGLTESQDTGPYEGETTATFTPVVPKFEVVTEWVSAEAAQAEQSGGAA